MSRGWTAMVRQGLALGLCAVVAVPVALGQESLNASPDSIKPVQAPAPWIFRPYLTTETPPIRLFNSRRLGSLIQGGNLYLTAQDAIALALENNVDIEIARYNPISTVWELERLQAGGALPGVPSGSSQAGAVASGLGVTGSQAAAGVSTGTNVGTGANASNATISQIGPVTQNLDPSIQEAASWSHITRPQTNTVQSQTAALIDNTRNYNTSAQVGTLSGGTFTLAYNYSYLNENSPSNVLNPAVAPSLAVSFQHNLLSGFGTAVNARNINAQKVNVRTSDLNFSSTLISTVVTVLNDYYTLVADYEDLRAKRGASEVAKRFYEDNKKQVAIGTMAPLDVISAESQVAATDQDLVVSQTTIEQQEAILKNVLSRTGTADPLLTNTRIIPLDRIVVPEKDTFPPLPELISTALRTRPDIAAEKNGIENAQLSALGTENGVLPFALVFGSATDKGLAGTPRVAQFSGRGVQTADPYFDGGIGNANAQIFRRNFPSERIGAFFQANIHNRQAQADEAIDQLTLRQTQLRTQKDINQVAVDIANQLVALRQARARYEASVRNRILEQQLFDAEQKKFALGASTTYNVISQQRDLTTSQSGEVAALVSYSNARVALDQVLGKTLENNNVKLEEAVSGRVTRPSSLPTPLPPIPTVR